jgi:N-formylglutamate deformylase
MESTHDFHLHQGSAPLLISMPHVGTAIPADMASTMTPAALLRQDTDWHLCELYAFAAGQGASVLSAQWSRYVVDLNRPPDNASLYPGLNTTGLCPLDTFAGAPLYQGGTQPDAAEVALRVERYWQPYHHALQGELARLLAHHGRVVLWEAHSIAAEVPRLFEGRLPDLNFGTADGRSCDPVLSAVLTGLARDQDRYSVVLDGRFKGGYITRHYGKPEQGVHAIQLELCQYLYMDETMPYAFRPERARVLQVLLRLLTGAAIGWAQR